MSLAENWNSRATGSILRTYSASPGGQFSISAKPYLVMQKKPFVPLNGTLLFDSSSESDEEDEKIVKTQVEESDEEESVIVLSEELENKKEDYNVPTYDYSGETVLSSPLVGEGTGSIAVIGDDIDTAGVTSIDGVVPIGGDIGFNGPLRASGSVTIIARSGPHRLTFPSYFPMTFFKVMPLAGLPRAEESSFSSSLPDPVSAGTGSLSVSGEMPVNGVTDLAGTVPIVGDVSFGGQVFAKGTVTICGSM
ncbi:unnamed protein product [Danaus chrysippus]|uniref:(African queen) hypothetical protein n=1 Tax=Danaus chrysippus TaxID=151541 RepID=A0A8J2QYQ0_9NEOP|nr:unnamed protein product [Danaus chrysippus]